MEYIECSLSDAVGADSLFCDGDWVESKDQDPNGDVRLIQLADVGDGEYLNKSARFMTMAKTKELNCTFLQAGDILVSRMPDPIGRACIFPGDAKPSVTVVDICIIRPNLENIDPRLLMRAINSSIFRSQIFRFATGTTRKRISRKNLEKLLINIPPLEEQKRIAAILDKADAIRKKRKQAIELTKQFLRSAFIGMFGAYFREEKNCEWKALKESAQFIDYRGKTPTKTKAGIKLITAKNVRQGYVAEEPKEYISPDDFEAWMTRGFPTSGDILFTTEAPLGHVAKLEHEGKVVIGQRLITLKFYDFLTSGYLLYCLQSQHIQHAALFEEYGQKSSKK